MKAELESFLKSNHHRVMMLQGPWGVGKTYFWKRFIEKQKPLLREDRYAYVSLFGVGSIASLKTLVVSSTELRASNTGSAPDVLAGLKALLRTGAARLTKMFSLFRGTSVPYLGVSVEALIAQVGELLIKKYLICFDDLERRQATLSMSELLGFISFLKENNDCRIIVICNESEIGAGDRDILATYREKIFDSNIAYRPSVEHNFKLVFGEASKTTLLPIFANLSVVNIRIMQLISWACDYFEDMSTVLEASVLTEFEEQVAKLFCLHYCCNPPITSQQIESYSILGSIFASGNPDDPANVRMRIFASIAFQHIEYDGLIFEYIRNGSCDKHNLRIILQDRSASARKRTAEANGYGILAKARGNFKATSEEILYDIEQLLSTEYSVLPFDWVLAFMDLVKQIAPTHTLRSLFLKALLHIVGTCPLEVLQKVERLPEVTQETSLREAIAKRHNSLVEEWTVGSLLEGLAKGLPWNEKYLERLGEFSEEEIVTWLNDASDEDLLKNVGGVLYKLSSEKHPTARTISDRFKKVLEEISRRNPLNAYRVHQVVFKNLLKS